ncbi:hypothetical protein D3C73_1530530 [compost metagenome]
MYEKGEGIPQDYAQSYAWYAVAAASGDSLATKERDRVAARLTPDQLISAQALATRYFEQAKP